MTTSTAALLYVQFHLVGLNRIFVPAATTFAVVAIVWRKEEIGGWLFYFYYWIFAVFVILAGDVVLHLRTFRPSYGHGAFHHGALYLAVFPRLAAVCALLVVALVMLKHRTPAWLERLRMFLLAGVVVSALSLWIDVYFFPTTLRANGGRLGGLIFWLLYFHFSKRVHRVFCPTDRTQPTPVGPGVPLP